MEWLFVPWIRQAVLLVHISSALFWLGWMVFIFFILFPVLKRAVPDSFPEIRGQVQQRTRSLVLWMIVLITVTGIYNMGAVGLFDLDLLFNSAYGHRFLVKLGAALTLFGVYFIAPLIMNPGQGDSCCDEETSPHPMLGIALHVIAFSSGIVAAYLGLGL